jgi:hypothetical protein
MPVLMTLEPTLSDVRAVEATAAHLDCSWARPTAFGPVHATRSWFGLPGINSEEPAAAKVQTDRVAAESS